MVDAHEQVYSDASGSWGCGAYQDPYWFQLEWSPRLLQLPIAVKQLIPVVLAAATFGHRWSGKVVKFAMDNAAVVEVIKVTYSKELHMMHLIRLLVFFAVKFDFWFTATHIPGKLNTLADALSRNNKDLFFSQAPQAAPQASPLSPALVNLLSLIITWTFTNWIRQFKHSIQQV